MWNIRLFFVLVVLAVDSGIAFSPYKLLLTVYYESKCSDTKRFVVHQLQPAVQLLHPYLNLKLVPFGKAFGVDYGFGGFECQHGLSECMGNMLQDCALNLMRDMNMTDVERVNYVACEMRTGASTRRSMECVQKSGLKAERVRHCIEYGKGTILQLDSEYLTQLVSPKFIPTVTIDGTFNQDIQDNSLIDLIGTMCSILKEKPPCAQYYNNMALRHLLHSSYQPGIIKNV